MKQFGCLCVKRTQRPNKTVSFDERANQKGDFVLADVLGMHFVGRHFAIQAHTVEVGAEVEARVCVVRCSINGVI